jgi:hypothetical protein
MLRNSRLKTSSCSDRDLHASVDSCDCARWVWIRISRLQFSDVCLKYLTGISTFGEVMSRRHLVRQIFRYVRLLNPSAFSITFSSRVKCRERETRIPQTSIRTTAKRKENPSLTSYRQKNALCSRIMSEEVAQARSGTISSRDHLIGLLAALLQPRQENSASRKFA